MTIPLLSIGTGGLARPLLPNLTGPLVIAGHCRKAFVWLGLPAKSPWANNKPPDTESAQSDTPTAPSSMRYVPWVTKGTHVDSWLTTLCETPP